MQSAITYYNFVGDKEEIITERFSILDGVQDCRELFRKLEEALSAPWDTVYGYAKEYFQENGNLNVPVKYRTKDGCALGAWL